MKSVFTHIRNTESQKVSLFFRFSKKIIHTHLIIAMFHFTYLEGLIERPVDSPLKISVIVPCHYKHFWLLQELLTYYQQQTVLPHEIVISLSECQNILLESIHQIEDFHWPFKLILIRNQEQMSASENRNMACLRSSGDVLICQDADDIPHPQRVEIIKYLFEKYMIDHLIHAFIWDTSFPLYELSNVDLLTEYHLHKGFFGGLYTNGEVVISREVYEKIKWPINILTGEDVHFNTTVYNTFNNTAICHIPLITYRNHLSSYKN